MSDTTGRFAETAQPQSKAATVDGSQASTAHGAAAVLDHVNARIGHYRWVICGLLFFATTINYVDRLVFSILGPELQKTFGWTNQNYTDIVFWFEVAYAIGLLTAGRLLDRIGTRIGYAVSLIFWSLAAILHAFMSTIAGFSVARFLLGLGEAGNFPAAIKTVAEWFPKKERALATGIFNAGSNVGAIIAPLAVPWLYVNYGWQWAFIFTGTLGMLWLVLWFALYRVPERHPKVSRAELAYIQSDPAEPTKKIAWLRLLPHKQTWAYVIAKFLTDSIWRWYLYLLPLFFSQKFKLDIKNFGPPFLVIYILADVGSIAGGWVSSYLIKRGYSVNFWAKDRFANLRDLRRASCVSDATAKYVVRGRPGWRRRRGAPGLVGKSFHDSLRHVSQTGSWVDCRTRRYGRRARGDADFEDHRLRVDEDGKFHRAFRYCRVSLPDFNRCDSSARAATRAGPN
jgi:ACS family hexuronate transporter-like MFS transporter